MKKPTLDLVNEHGGIMLMLSILEKVAKRLKDSQDIPQGHLRNIVEFLTNFADRCHHGKEEDMLFPEMVKQGVEERIINEYIGEHKSGRDLIRGMSESLPYIKPGNAHAVHFAVNAQAYVTLLKDHILGENTFLFPLADKKIPSSVQESLEMRFEEFEKNAIGEGKHEEYHGWLEELKKTYLG